MDILALYDLWKEKATADPDLTEELISIEKDKEAVNDRFYKCLEFGTGGLRGVIGAGTNRMNIYTVNQATQGLAMYLNNKFENPTVAIAYDSRIKSDVFAKSAAGVLAANNIKVYFYPELVPTPMLSFAIRYYGCKSGIIITASHNPSEYNGYKCYDPEGYQMTDEAAAVTLDYIQKTDIFKDVKTMDFDEAVEKKWIEFVGREVFEAFYDKVEEACLSKDFCEKTDFNVIYTPLNGTGNKPVREMLKRIGMKNVRVVKEQKLPDGNFPTCPYPNPEIKQVFELAFEMAKEEKADLILATDPDCDRAGIAVLAGDEYKLMSGNEVGVLLTEYLLSRREELGTLPKDPIIIKSFVTTDLVDAVAKKHAAETVNLLTGFKYIGEYITALEKNGEADRFVAGMEESYGYLSGIHARDKDAVVASVLICEMAAYYKAKGLSLYELMQKIYKDYGYYINETLNIKFPGEQGMIKMGQIMDKFRNDPPTEIAGEKVLSFGDYLSSVEKNMETGEEKEIKLPKSNVLCFKLPDSNKVIMRPSGTEPKLKIYITSCGKTQQDARAIYKRLAAEMENKIKCGNAYDV